MVRSNNLAWVEPRGELLEAGLALETEGVILHFGFGHHQVGDVLSVLLSTFNVKEDVEGSWGGVLLLGWCHLDEAAVGLNVHLQAGHGADPQRCSSLSCRPRNSLKHPETFLRLWQTEGPPDPAGLPSWVRPRWLARQVGP